MADAHELRLLWAGNRGLFALLAAGRGMDAVTRVPRLGWVVSDPVVARRVLGDHTAFSMTGEGGVGHLWTQLFGPELERFFGGAGHVDLRRSVRDLFTEDAAHALVERVQGSSHRELTGWLARGEPVDLAALVRGLAGRLVADLLGFPEQPSGSYAELYAAGERLAALAVGTTASTELDGARIDRARRVVDDLTAHVPAAYAGGGPDTLLGRCRDLGLGLPVARGLATLLVIAGTETGASGTLRTVALLHDTGQQRLLLDRPDLLDGAVREGLRVAAPAPVIGRHVARDTVLEGRRLRAGDRVLLLTHTATNAAGAFDITRPYVPDTRQLWFGGGRHLCLGAAVARRQVAAVVEALHATGRPYRVLSRAPARGVLVPTYRALTVTAASAGRAPG